MSRNTYTVPQVLKFIARHNKIASLIGIAIFLPEVIKLFVKGIADTEIVEIAVLGIEIVAFLIYLYIIRLIKKRYGEKD
ncbi:MAG: hypothetical protein GX824_02015 [Clostridiales bacterium]|jgi:uncharacterized protein with PQ loop repeat|nr:hypothetical protein [Clostridiales bacterium]